MQNLRQIYIVAILGKKGSGKTTLTKELAEQLVVQGDKVLWISPVERPRTYEYAPWGVQETGQAMRVARPGEIVYLGDVREGTVTVALASVVLHRPWVVVIDEVDKVGRNKELLDLVHYCRHVNCVLIVNSRRYADVPRLLTSQADLLFVGRTHEPRDLQYVRDVTDRDFAERVRQLDKHEFLRLNTETWESSIVEPNPEGAKIL